MMSGLVSVVEGDRQDAPGLEHEVALQLDGDGVLELVREALHARVVLVVQQRPHAQQVLRTRRTFTLAVHRGLLILTYLKIL